jgi:spoIIIJ-associated protein
MGPSGSIFEGKTLDDAVRKGLEALGLSRAEVMITMLEEGSAGFLGLGARPYKVRVMPRPGGPPPEPFDRGEREGRGRRERDRDRRGRGPRGGREERRGGAAPDRAARGDDRRPAHDRARADVRGERIPREGRPAGDERPARAGAPGERGGPAPAEGDRGRRRGRRGGRGRGGERGPERERGFDRERGPEREPRPRDLPPVGNVAIESDEAPMAETARGPERESLREPERESLREPEREPHRGPERESRRGPEREPQGPALSPAELEAQGRQWTERLLAAMGFEATVTATATEDRVDVTAAVAEHDDLLTGRKGEVRQALQHLLNRMINRGEGSRYHLQLEINDFWRRREEELREIALQLAERAVESGAEAVTEYLNAQERRVIHVTLREDTRVKTYALGTGMIKRLAVAPADYPEQPRDDE